MLSKSQRRLQSMCLLAAKAHAPIDTGLLRHRAIKTRAIQNGFVIKWDGRVAFYLGFVNEGVNGNESNAGFIERGILSIEGIVADYYVGGRDDTYARSLANSRTVRQGFDTFDEKRTRRLDNLMKANKRRYEDRLDEFAKYRGGRL